MLAASAAAAVRAAPTHVGTAFEERTRRILTAALPLALTRVGGRGDGGVDLRGWAALPGARRIRVLAQCKAHSRPLGPSAVRELEGVLAGAPAALGILACQARFTRGAVLRAQVARAPLLLVSLPPPDVGAARAVWNPALVRLLGADAELRWERGAGGARPGLWVGGVRVPGGMPEGVEGVEDVEWEIGDSGAEPAMDIGSVSGRATKAGDAS